jgi:hypothetical protein
MSEISSVLENKHNTLIVDDLLKGTSEWRNIDDIIRLTFKALTEVVKI